MLLSLPLKNMPVVSQLFKILVGTLERKRNGLKRRKGPLDAGVLSVLSLSVVIKTICSIEIVL